MAISSRLKPEICFSTVDVNAPKSTTVVVYSVAVDRIPNLPIERQTLCHWVICAHIRF